MKLSLNHQSHTDYFKDVLTTFLGLELVSCVAAFGGSESTKSSNYLNLSSKDSVKVLTGLERHEGDKIITDCSFLSELTLYYRNTLKNKGSLSSSMVP